MKIDVQVWRCPVHGLIESPRWFGIYGPDDPETRMVCPINLSTDERGITDDVCDKACKGPLVVVVEQESLAVTRCTSCGAKLSCRYVGGERGRHILCSVCTEHEFPTPTR